MFMIIRVMLTLIWYAIQLTFSVVILSVRGLLVRKFMLAAYELGMTKGDFTFLDVELFQVIDKLCNDWFWPKLADSVLFVSYFMPNSITNCKLCGYYYYSWFLLNSFLCFSSVVFVVRAMCVSLGVLRSRGLFMSVKLLLWFLSSRYSFSLCSWPLYIVREPFIHYNLTTSSSRISIMETMKKRMAHVYSFSNFIICSFSLVLRAQSSYWGDHGWKIGDKDDAPARSAYESLLRFVHFHFRFDISGWMNIFMCCCCT